MSNAKLVELPGDDHFPWVGDVDALTGEIQQFVTGETQSQKTSRILASILFTDIVASTDLAQRVGDQSWKELLDRHDKMTLEAVAFFQGRLIDNTGDGMLATFDGPGRGIACAKEIMKKGDSLGLDIRAGLHTGECEIRDERVAGVAVHLAARVMGLAGIGEVLVSRTVRDLVAGSGFTFHEHGEHSLKGFDDKWLIYSVD
ncbi:MAG: adenylate/guanylate cyclase domain-containing protein [Rhodobacteraceae bacterium]|nr:adenylate/guanylate cyclase domain-containing protein [Paracoccaceae bacterium]